MTTKVTEIKEAKPEASQSTALETPPVAPTLPASPTMGAGIDTKPDPAKSVLTAGQQKIVDDNTLAIHALMVEFQGARQKEGKVVHARLVKMGAESLAIVRSMGGDKEAMRFVSVGSPLWGPFIDVSKTPETHKYTGVQTYKGSTTVEARASASVGLRNYVQYWGDLIRWEIGLLKPANPKSGFPGERPVTGGLMVNGKSYTLPSQALEASNTVTSVYQAWRNAVRPNIVVLDELPSLTAHKALFQSGIAAAADVSIVMREKRRVGKDNAARLQKVKKNAEEMPPAAILGIIAGLLGAAMKKGITQQALQDELTKAAQASNEPDPAEETV